MMAVLTSLVTKKTQSKLTRVCDYLKECETRLCCHANDMPRLTHRGIVWMMKIVCPRTDSLTSTLVSILEAKKTIISEISKFTS